MLTKLEKKRIIEWITCDGQVDGIQEEAMPRADIPNVEIDDFIATCGDILLDWISNHES
jgi:hypothetical protein